MPTKALLSAAFLASAVLLHACSGSGKKSDAPVTPQTPTGETGKSDPSNNADGTPSTKPSGADKKTFSKEKTEKRFQTSTKGVLAITAATSDADAQKILNEHFLAIECGTHVFGEDWDAKRRDLLRKELDTSEKQDAYVRAQSRLASKVITLHDLSALDTLCK